MCNAEPYSKTKFKNVLSHAFKIKNKLRQRDVMSLALFDLALESMIRKVPRTESLTLRNGSIILAYADIVVIIGKTHKKKGEKSMI